MSLTPNMNFGRIFLVRCLLLLFPSVRCSITNQIYTAVNESVHLSISPAAAGVVHDATWTRDKRKLLQIKDKKVKYYVTRDQCRCKVFLNGTLQIEKALKEDSGKYTVAVYEQDGKLRTEEDTMLFVLEPVPQPVLSGDCVNKTVSAKCEVKQKTRDETFLMELTQHQGKKLQQNATAVELHTRGPGTFTCVVRNEISAKRVEKAIKCPGQLDLHLIFSIAGGAVFFVIFVMSLIYCIRRKKAKRPEGNGEEEMTPARQVSSGVTAREPPKPPRNPTPRQQPRPRPQPIVQQQLSPPRPKPRTQHRTANQLRDIV